MCTTCNGLGRVVTSPMPGIMDVESCSCVNDTQGLVKLEQQMQILDKNIADFEKGILNADSL